MIEVAVLAGLVVAGVAVGVWRTSRTTDKKKMPSPFQDN
jgi:hypothetical protein